MAYAKFPAALMRGGTSRGLFFRGGVLPDDAAVRERILLRALGGNDKYRRQIDGVGGGISSTSKAVVVSRSTRPGIDVDYWFMQVGIDRPHIDYTSNCGNLSSAVGPFAIEEGLVPAVEGITTVRIWQVNTNKLIVAQVPTQGGFPVEDGDYRLAGVSVPGAEIKVEFHEPGGSGTGALLPTGNPVDELGVPGYGTVRVTMLDAATVMVYVRAEDFGLSGTELADRIDGDPELLEKLATIRAAAGVRLGLSSSIEDAKQNRPSTPKIAIVAPPQSYTTAGGERIEASQIDFLSRIMSMGRLHHAHAVTGAIATAVAAVTPGTLVNAVAGGSNELRRTLRIGHPSGIIEVGAEVRLDGHVPFAVKGVVGRTARRIMEGSICVPPSAISGTEARELASVS